MNTSVLENLLNYVYSRFAVCITVHLHECNAKIQRKTSSQCIYNIRYMSMVFLLVIGSLQALGRGLTLAHSSVI